MLLVRACDNLDLSQQLIEGVGDLGRHGSVAAFWVHIFLTVGAVLQQHTQLHIGKKGEIVLQPGGHTTDPKWSSEQEKQGTKDTRRFPIRLGGTRASLDVVMQ